MGWVDQVDTPQRLAVKVYRTGHTSDRGAGAVMRDVMWEVHVLRQVQHEHIVRLCDVIELCAAAAACGTQTPQTALRRCLSRVAAAVAAADAAAAAAAAAIRLLDVPWHAMAMASLTRSLRALPAAWTRCTW